MADINQLDLAFVVDTTGSMQPLINAAQRQMVDMIEALTRAAEVDMRLGIVEYRDHPPEDTLVFRVFPFTGDLKGAKKTINALQAGGGGDLPEAVFAGLVAAANLAWRKHARRIAVLVGDAPPHGVGCQGDAFRHGCPSGETIHSTSAKLEGASIRLYAIGLTPIVQESFGLLSSLTGGKLFTAAQENAAIQQLAGMLQEEFGQLRFDQQVYESWRTTREPNVEGVAAGLGAPPAKVAAAVSRLFCRDLLKL